MALRGRTIAVALLALGAGVLLLRCLYLLRRRPSADETPRPQPTESEAIVAAEREAQTPHTPLVPPVPYPVDKAASGESRS
jgi:hypothetical protein